MKNIRRFTAILLTICAVLVCASCKKCNDDKNKNIVVPAISNPDGTFFKVGNFTVTNKEAYHQLLNSYGIETLLNKIDNDRLPAVKDEEAFKEYLDEIIYGDEEKTDEALNEFLEDLPLSGLTKENYEDYYRLNYRRIEAAKEQYISEMKEDHYTDEDLEAAFENLYRKNNDLIIIRFDSRKEANAYLENAGIDLNFLNGGWKNESGKDLTAAEVLAVFENIAKEMNGTDSSAIKTYTYEDLRNVNTSLASSVYNWKAGQYSKAPTMYGKQLYLVYKNAESKNLDENTEVTFEDKKADVKDYLIESEVSSTYATKVALEKQLENGLKIYDESLENMYKLTYDNVYKNLSITEYDAFETTDEQSDKNVFTYTVNGKSITVTADELFKELKDNYGTYLSALYLKQYIVLKDNKVFDITTNTILDQAAYDKYYKTDVTEYKEAFEDGDYASLGYSANYGWENFIRDYLGLLSEQKILINLDSSLYKEEYNKFKDVLTLGEEVKDAEGNITTTVDQAIQDKMKEIFDNYLNVTAIAVKAYYDKDLDNKADEVEANSAEEIVIKNILSVVYEEATKLDESLATALSTVILEYNLATATHPVWGQYKKAGVELALVSSASYNASSKQDEIVLNHLRAEYKQLLDFDNETNGTDLSGDDLSKDFTYTYTADGNDVTTTINAFNFVDAANDVITCENEALLYFVTKVVKPYYINTSEGKYQPTREQYNQYLTDPSDLTTSVKNCITTYYIPAINELATETAVSNYIMEEALELLSGITYEDVEALRTYINACIEDTNTEE